MERRCEDKSNMTKVILAVGLLCILLGAGMSFVINVKPEEGDLLLSDFQQADEIVISENPRFKNLQEQRLRDKLYAFINQDDQGKVVNSRLVLNFFFCFMSSSTTSE